MHASRDLYLHLLAAPWLRVLAIFASVFLVETFSQTVHARYRYAAGDVAWNARFAGIIQYFPDGRREIDYARFHDVVPLRE